MFQCVRVLSTCVLLLLCQAPLGLAQESLPQSNTSSTDEASAENESSREGELLNGIRQITFEGRRAGEGYFSSDGNRMVFQSERDPANPFYQIYLTDLQTGDIQRISPGHGKTTCAWIHPDGLKVLFASTQDDPQAGAKQQQEIDMRNSGTQRRYAWDYDEQFDLYDTVPGSGQYTRLTSERGYDAEASYSPDGQLIVFASNRAAYESELTGDAKERFDIDPSSMVDLYLMNADGTNVRRLTDVAGYDGGPFFSADGSRICWRRFSEDGATAEIYTMKIDGSDVKRLTEIGAMSWAPYFHPSGDYLIFTTNKHGFGNFELYLVRSDGQGQPVRVTYTDGFDGLPVFLPDGQRLSWTSNRGESKQSQIVLADWDDAKARELLGLASPATEDNDRSAALVAAESSSPEFSATDLMKHVDFLTRPDLGGRLTGTEGERRATGYVAAYLESLGFEPAGSDGTFFHQFEFPAGSHLTANNQMTSGGKMLALDSDWRPMSFSKDGQMPETGIVFAGYGLQVPAENGSEEYDSYVHLNVAGQWVMVLRDLPQEITPERRQQLARYSTPRRKATIARDMGARGIVFVAGPTSKVKSQLIRFDEDGSQASLSITAVSISNDLAENWFRVAGKDLAKIQAELDDGSLQLGFPIEGAKAAATVEIERRRGTGRNVIARLPAAGESSQQAPMLILGAHIDHLGRGGSSNSLANEDEQDQVHVGADDNASGVAAMLEIAQHLAHEKRSGRLNANRDLIVAAWSGEELGLFGSQAFVDDFYKLFPKAPRAQAESSEAASESNSSPAESGVPQANAHGDSSDSVALTPAVAAYMNMDMVGRLREKLVIQGIGSSPSFADEVQRRNLPVGLTLQLDRASSRLPTDTSAFVGRNVPILSAFTGAHEDYHTPRDTPDKLNYDGATKISRLFALIARGFLLANEAPAFALDEGDAGKEVPRARLTAYLGTIPDYVAGDIKGLKLSGVAKEGPAAVGGIQGGDIIIELAGRKIEDIYDYTYAIEALKVGQEVEIVIKRGDETIKKLVTPASRE